MRKKIFLTAVAVGVLGVWGLSGVVSLGAGAPGSMVRYARATRCKVPRVAGLTVREARPKLERAGCRLGARHPRHLGPAAVIIATSPQTGALLPLRARVSVFLRIR
jgi:beta-lactam-binding protein with PASTA domain